MSYCRWSSDNWRCDLYCYEDVSGGWTTHVAGNRVMGDIPKELPLPPSGSDTADFEPWCKRHQEIMAFLETAERQDIELPHVGETFNDPTLEAFRDRLLELRRVGYNFPDYVLEEIAEEIAHPERV